MYSAFQFRIHQPNELSTDSVKRWETLLARQAYPNAFLSPAFALAAQTAFGRARVLEIFRENTSLGFFPYRMSAALGRALRAAEPIAGHLSDYFGVIGDKSLSISPAQLLRGASLSSLLFTHLDENQLRYGLEGTAPRIGLRIRLAANQSSLPNAIDKTKFEKDTERRAKKLQAAHGIIHLKDETEQPDALDWIIRMKTHQYRRTGQKRYPLRDKSEKDFLHSLRLSDSDLCRPRLHSLYAGEERVAAHYGLQCADNLAYWFPVYDTRFSAYSPGRLLLLEILKACPSLGIACVDRGEGESAAKLEFANESHLFYRGYYLRPGIRSTVDHIIKSASWRLPNLR